MRQDISQAVLGRPTPVAESGTRSPGAAQDVHSRPQPC
jgi:hypothetical protein